MHREQLVVEILFEELDPRNGELRGTPRASSPPAKKKMNELTT